MGRNYLGTPAIFAWGPPAAWSPRGCLSNTNLPGDARVFCLGMRLGTQPNVSCHSIELICIHIYIYAYIIISILVQDLDIWCFALIAQFSLSGLQPEMQLSWFERTAQSSTAATTRSSRDEVGLQPEKTSPRRLGSWLPDRNVICYQWTRHHMLIHYPWLFRNCFNLCRTDFLVLVTCFKFGAF